MPGISDLFEGNVVFLLAKIVEVERDKGRVFLFLDFKESLDIAYGMQSYFFADLVFPAPLIYLLTSGS